jgi:hypothetical protein
LQSYGQKTALVGVSGMHAVCVCTIHQNVKLTISGVKLYDLTEKQVKTYDDYLFKMK